MDNGGPNHRTRPWNDGSQGHIGKGLVPGGESRGGEGITSSASGAGRRWESRLGQEEDINSGKRN